MKFPIIILAVLGLVCGKSVSTGSLLDDLKEFMDLVPKDKVLEIALDYLANDQEVRDLVVYIQSEEFPKIHTIIEHIKENKYCLKFINDHGVDVYAIINEIHDILGMPPFHPTNTTRVGVGIRGFIDDVIAVLPLDDLTALFDKKMETSKDFKALITVIHSSVIMKMVDTLQAWPEYHEMLEILREKVVDVHRIIELLRELYWREIRSFQDDLHDFMALVPTNKVFDIVLDYLSNDKEVQEIVFELQSEEFPMIHTTVEYLKEYKECLKFINDRGIDVYAIFILIHDFLDLPPFQPTNTTRVGVGIRGLVDNVIAVLPLDNLKALFDKKTETREYFKALVIAFHSTLFADMVDTMKTWPEYKKLLEILREKGVDVDRITEILRTFFGLSWRGVPLNTTRQRLDGRIFGGRETTITNRPYQVSVLQWGTYRCSGSIISAKWVVTLELCVPGDVSSVSVRSGSAFSNFGGTLHSATSVIRHENVTLSLLDYDIAVVQVFPAFTFSASVQPITLECNPVPVGTAAVVSGWGVPTPENLVLRQAFVQILSDYECRSNYGDYLTDRMICAGDPNLAQGACGDYGGPLVANNKLVGMYSWGGICGDIPDVYTKVSALCDWIVINAGLYKISAIINWINPIPGLQTMPLTFVATYSNN